MPMECSHQECPNLAWRNLKWRLLGLIHGFRCSKHDVVPVTSAGWVRHGPHGPTAILFTECCHPLPMLEPQRASSQSGLAALEIKAEQGIQQCSWNPAYLQPCKLPASASRMNLAGALTPPTGSLPSLLPPSPLSSQPPTRPRGENPKG
jgi:hypothetical protein